MTVGELIEQLKTMDKDLPVVVYAGEHACDPTIIEYEYGFKIANSVHLDCNDLGTKYVLIED